MSMLDLADAYVHAGLTAGAADVPARLITLRDLLELEATPEFDADAVLGRVRSWGAEAPVARAVRLVEDRLRPDRPPALAGWARQLRRRPGGPLPHALLHELGPQLPPPAGRGGVRAGVAGPSRAAPRPDRAATGLPARPGLDPPRPRQPGGAQARPLRPAVAGCRRLRASCRRSAAPPARSVAGSVGVVAGRSAARSAAAPVRSSRRRRLGSTVDTSGCGHDRWRGRLSTQGLQMMSAPIAATLVVTAVRAFDRGRDREARRNVVAAEFDADIPVGLCT